MGHRDVGSDREREGRRGGRRERRQMEGKGGGTLRRHWAWVVRCGLWGEVGSNHRRAEVTDSDFYDVGAPYLPEMTPRSRRSSRD